MKTISRPQSKVRKNVRSAEKKKKQTHIRPIEIEHAADTVEYIQKRDDVDGGILAVVVYTFFPPATATPLPPTVEYGVRKSQTGQ